MPPKAYDATWVPVIAGQLAREGKSHTKIAAFIGIGIKEFRRWVAAHPELADSLANNTAVADAKVEASQFQRACGYDYEEKKVIGTQSKEGKVAAERVEIIKKHVPGDVTAQIFYLKNRRPDRWRDRHEYDFYRMSDDELVTVAEGLFGRNETPGPLSENPSRQRRILESTTGAAD